jgi:hypothetical protein
MQEEILNKFITGPVSRKVKKNIFDNRGSKNALMDNGSYSSEDEWMNKGEEFLNPK